ncbi:uncharacterized protein SPPG_03721 [Spizellomyces punctatus DAOM BR117]|uniref:Uncharacterized protein n=1 Tax=Spizellomyces punctatus (strain DAOM BR117) TaxID=645134 RepID=A0A0L0HHP0_SPIPD|nr:uncharacterized protein SPPG_03721 [Spizellomyces punctatus DAOM BR117]KND00597.1 hypothetical protein SPPG_03721 [Spizellomyces punctatus DAOM BR117]|eukprot:XP_016608636.1 hypothetical protein SPPG_03721 [Spizellomyces punctatus DAOM BR117]
MAVAPHLHTNRSSRPSYPIRKRTPDHFHGPVEAVQARQPAPLPPPSVAGTAAELDTEPPFVEELQATWDLIETGAYSDCQESIELASIHLPDHEEDPVRIELNGVMVELPSQHAISLETLGLGPNNFLYVDGIFKPLTRDGIPLEELRAKDGIKLRTQAYPAIQPLAYVYWCCMQTVPSRDTIANFLQSPWGRTIVNAANALLMALMARPGINISSPPVQVIVAVVSGARMLDLMIKETILKLLTEAKLSLSHALFALLVCEICLIIGASIPFRCLLLIEYHLLPLLFVAWTCVGSLIHGIWILGGHLSKGRGLKGVIIGQILWCLPVLLFTAILMGDIILRMRMDVNNLLTCDVEGVASIGMSTRIGELGLSGGQPERIML